METASQRESRLVEERRREEAKPTLVGQLKLLREQYGEGFDEDIAQPLARGIVKIRKSFEAMNDEHEDEVHRLQSEKDELEMKLDDAPDPDTIRRMEEDLLDVQRGVLDLEELFDRWDVRVPV